MEINRKIFKRTGKGAATRKNKWCVRLEWIDPKTGKERGADRHFKTHNAAADGAAPFEAEIRERDGLNLDRNASMLFKELVEISKMDFFHKATYETGMKTGGIESTSTVNSVLKTLNQYFGERMIGSIDGADLRRYRVWRVELGSQNFSLVKKGIRAEVSPATINRELGICRRMLIHAWDEGWIPKNPFRNANAIHKRLEKPRTRVLTLDEFDRLIAACDGEHVRTYERKRRANLKSKAGEPETLEKVLKVDNPYMKPFLLLMGNSGLRRGEALKLKWSDLDFEIGTVTLRPQITKTEMGRIVPLTDRTIEALESIRELHENGNIFPKAISKKDGKPGGEKDFIRPWRMVKKIAGIPDVNMHDLRRTASTVLVKELGLPLEYASKLLGHTTPEITERHYMSVDQEAIQRVKDGLNALHLERSIMEPHSRFAN